MKHAVMLSVLAALLLAGCIYESPLTKEHNISVDSAVLGLWEPIPDEGEEPKHNDWEPRMFERMMILKYSNTEYLIHYPIGDGWYYRGYPIQIGGISCVQLQVIGIDDEKELFHVVSYQLTDGILEFKTLNTDLVDDNLKTTEALVEAFLNHKDNKELFTNPGSFRRTDE